MIDIFYDPAHRLNHRRLGLLYAAGLVQGAFVRLADVGADVYSDAAAFTISLSLNDTMSWESNAP